ncbi:unnamed protein product [Cutaneotrichosporon oleaginosum]
MSSARASVLPSRAASTRFSPGTSFVEDGGRHAVTIIQGKAAGVELGIAAFNWDTGRITLTQVADTSLYARTIQHLHLHYPSDVLVAETSHSAGYGNVYAKAESSSKLVDAIQKEIGIKCSYLQRSVWNAEMGYEAVKRYCVEDPYKTPFMMVLSDRYYAQCAAAALLHWLATSHSMSFNCASLKIEYETVRGQMFIDAESVRNLEIVQNNLSKKTPNTLFYRSVINNRLDAVEELIDNPTKLRLVRKSLSSISKIDLDKLIANVRTFLWRLTHPQLSQDIGSSEYPSLTEFRLGNLLSLRKVVKEMAELSAVLQGSSAHLLELSSKVLSDRVLVVIADILDDVTTNIKASKRQLQKHARLYAVKNGIDSLLDVARSTLAENEADIHALKAQIEEEYDFEPMLEWSEAGYRFSVPTELVDRRNLPRGMLNVERSKKYIKFTTHELLKRNARMKQSQQEVFVMSDKFVSSMVRELVAYLPSLFSGSDAIALVDVITSFAGISSSRPKFGSSIEIKNGRHAILEATLPAGDIVPNDVFATHGSSHFQIIQGPNMSGKSTYLRQIALLTIMAMVGCFLPAESAIIWLPDCLLSRLSNDDNMQKSLSTFAAEMATSAMILRMATSRSLVLIDELGRGTSPIEGVGLSQAIAEKLIKTQCFTFFATHFRELALTLCTTAGVQNLHLQVQRNSHMAESSEFATTFHYKIQGGKCKDEHYGKSWLELAKLAALPPDVLATAWEVSTKIIDFDDSNRNEELARAVAKRRKAILELYSDLVNVLETARGDDPGTIAYLRKKKTHLIQILQDALRIEQETNPSDMATVSAGES